MLAYSNYDGWQFYDICLRSTGEIANDLNQEINSTQRLNSWEITMLAVLQSGGVRQIGLYDPIP